MKMAEVMKSQEYFSKLIPWAATAMQYINYQDIIFRCHLKILTESDTPTPVPSKSSSNNYNASSTHPVSQPQHSVPTVYDNTDKPSPPSPQPFSHLTSSLEPPSSTTPLFAVQILFSLHSAQTSLSGNV